MNFSPVLMADLLSWWTSPGNWLAMLQVLIALGLVIFVHELGHFVVAKLCGVKCEKFYVGFDFFDIKIGNTVIIPRSLIKFQWGETEYGIGIIPLGGYVKMLGQDDNPANAQRELERSQISKEELARRKDSSTQYDGIEPGSTGDPASSERESGEELVLDPRSYQAKTVLQRMMIISAGVIMNLIFAVIFATIAFRMGVNYSPAEIGAVIPGDPAWTVGLRPGDKILQLGRGGSPSEHLRFRRDLSSAIILNGAGVDLDVLVRHADEKEQWYTLRPTPNRRDSPQPTIGIQVRQEPVVSKLGVLKHFPAAKATPTFKPDDKIVAIGAADDGSAEDVTDDLSYNKILAAHADKTVIYYVERPREDAKEGETSVDKLQIKVEPRKYRRWGLVMESGPISGIYPGSPAAKANLALGDRIVKVIVPQNGKEPLIHEVNDPVDLPQILMPYYRREIKLEVVRDDGKPKTRTVKITPQVPDRVLPVIHMSSPFSCQSLGIVYPVFGKVRAVKPGSPAEKAGIRKGDKIAEVQFIPLDEESDQIFVVDEPIPLDEKENLNWPYVLENLQQAEPGRTVQLKYHRNGNEKSVKIDQTIESGYFAFRGVGLKGKTNTRTASSWGDAFSLGVRETQESAQMVLVFLKKLVTFQLSPLYLGGPGTIALVATSEATRGLPKLLIFLTLFSANLAVVNFLPIPVLDGGHMLFLIAEGIRGKPLNEKWMQALTLLGLCFILSLMLFVIGLDVFRFAQIL